MSRIYFFIFELHQDLEYIWTFDILYAKVFLIQQNRERLFVVGFRRDLNIDGFNFPKKNQARKNNEGLSFGQCFREILFA